MSLRKIMIIYWLWVSPTPFSTNAKLPIIVQLSGLVYSTMGIRIHSILGLLPLFDTIWGFGFSIMYHPAMGYLHLWTTPFLKTYVSKSNDGCHSLAAVSLPRGCCSTAWGPNTG